MANELQNKKIAFVITPECAEQVESVTDLYEAVTNAGGMPELLMANNLAGRAYEHLCEILLGRKLRSPRRVSAENGSDYQGLVMPCVANAGPSQMDQEMDQNVASFVMEFVKGGGINMKIRPPK